jgi:hypothetical protein
VLILINALVMMPVRRQDLPGADPAPAGEASSPSRA